MSKVKFFKLANDGSNRRMWHTGEAYPMVVVHEWEENKKFSVTRYSDGDTETGCERFTDEIEALAYAEKLAS